MTDSHLMDADCIHGVVWYECQECEQMTEPQMILSKCSICRGVIDWIECPTGGWWHHWVHPDDDHDAVPEEPVPVLPENEF